MRVPSPADFVKGYTAPELLDAIREKGGRVYRMREAPVVFCLTTSQECASFLLDMGAKPFRPVHMPEPLHGGYERSRGGVREWDLVIHMIETEGEESIWEAAA